MAEAVDCTDCRLAGRVGYSGDLPPAQPAPSGGALWTVLHGCGSYPVSRRGLSTPRRPAPPRPRPLLAEGVGQLVAAQAGAGPGSRRGRAPWRRQGPSGARRSRTGAAPRPPCTTAACHFAAIHQGAARALLVGGLLKGAAQHPFGAAEQEPQVRCEAEAARVGDAVAVAHQGVGHAASGPAARGSRERRAGRECRGTARGSPPASLRRRCERRPTGTAAALAVSRRGRATSRPQTSRGGSSGLSHTTRPASQRWMRTACSGVTTSCETAPRGPSTATSTVDHTTGRAAATGPGPSGRL